MKFPLIELIAFLIILATIIFIWYQNQKKQEKPEKEIKPAKEIKTEKMLPQKKKFSWGWAVVIFLALWIGYGILKPFLFSPAIESSIPARGAEMAKAEMVQIYPNYEFQKGVNQIKVPLIPSHYILPREAGGWVTTPHGSRYEIDYKIPVTIEYIDGRKFYRESNKPAWDEVIIENRIFRIYGQEGQFAEVRIKRGVY
ncbi:MAG: hypothetical protein AAB696_00030 [Patescibacteria group bacterium]